MSDREQFSPAEVAGAYLMLSRRMVETIMANLSEDRLAEVLRASNEREATIALEVTYPTSGGRPAVALQLVHKGGKRQTLTRVEFVPSTEAH